VLAGKDHAWPPRPDARRSAGAGARRGRGDGLGESDPVVRRASRCARRGRAARLRLHAPRRRARHDQGSVSDGGALPVYDYPARFTLGAYDGGPRAYGAPRGEPGRASAARSSAPTRETRAVAVERHGPHARDAASRSRATCARGSTATVVVAVEHHAPSRGATSPTSSGRASASWRSCARGAAGRALGGGASPSARYHNRFVRGGGGDVAARAGDAERPVISGPQTAW
jgi:hypothetical protein